MSSSSAPEKHKLPTWVSWIRARPGLLAALIFCWLACFVCAYLLMPDSYSLGRRLSMGFFGGLFSSLCLIAGRLFNQQEG